MASEFVDLVHQVNGVLPVLFGGTGNGLGYGTGTITAALNSTGSTFPQFSAVTYTDLGTVVLTTTDYQIPVLGIVVGVFNADGTILEGTAPTGSIAAVLIQGSTGVLVDSHVSYGDYLYTTSANPGHLIGNQIRHSGAVGQLIAAMSAPAAFARIGFSAQLGGPTIYTEDGVTVNLQTDQVGLATELPGRSGIGGQVGLSIDTTKLFIDANQIADTSIVVATGSTLLRPSSDILVTHCTFSAGTHAWSILDQATLNTANYVIQSGFPLVAGQAIMGFPDAGLDQTYRITSLELHCTKQNAPAASASDFAFMDPLTSRIWNYVGTIPNGGTSATITKTVRPWDGEPWSLSDLAALWSGPIAGGDLTYYQYWIVVNWIHYATVGTIANKIWRPLLTSGDAIITAGAGGEAIMGLGPA